MDTDVTNRFGYHKPDEPHKGEACNVMRTRCAMLAQEIKESVPAGREQSLALTKLEEVMMWANAGIARSWGAPERFAELPS